MATQMYIIWKVKNYTSLDLDYDIKFNSPVFNVVINAAETQWRIEFVRPYVAGTDDTDLAIKVRLVSPENLTSPITYHIHLIDASNNDIIYTFKSEDDVFNLTQCSESLLKEFNLFVELNGPKADSATPIWQEAQSFFEPGNAHLSYVMFPTVPNGSHVIKKLVIDKQRTKWCMKFLCSLKHNRKMLLTLSHPPKNWAIVFQCEDYNFMTKRNESRSLIFDEHESEHEINAGYKDKSYILHAVYCIRSVEFGSVNPNLVEKFKTWLLPIIIAERETEQHSTVIKTKAEPAPVVQPCSSSIIPTAATPFQQANQGFWNYSYEPQKLKHITPLNWNENDLKGCATTAVQKIQNLSIYPELAKVQNLNNNPHQQPQIQGPMRNIYSIPPPPIYNHDSNRNFLKEMYDKKQFCDVQLCIDGKIIVAHKLVLASCCSYFRDLLSNSDTNATIELTKYDYVTMEALVSFIYNGSLPLLPVTVLEQLLSAADEFEMTSLKRCCEAELGATLSLQSVPALLVLAHRKKANILMTMAVGFVRIHLAELKKEKGLLAIFHAYPNLAYDLFLQFTSE